MHILDTNIVDTFAEAFEMWAARVIITAETPTWAAAAAQSMTGFATSVIGCKCESAIERKLAAARTPDKRPGVSVLLFAMDAPGVAKRLLERVGQCIMTCPTTACFNGLEGNKSEASKSVVVGGQLRYFGDGYQISKVLDDDRFWRVPVMDGEFLVADRFHVQPAVGGGNIFILGKDLMSTLRAAEDAAKAMKKVKGVILPFPNGVTRSGSKIGSKYTNLIASTNDEYCPSLRGIAPATKVPSEADSVLEIVVDGLDLAAVEEAMRRGIQAAAEAGAVQISAGNYGGKLGKYKIGLHGLLRSEAA